MAGLASSDIQSNYSPRKHRVHLKRDREMDVMIPQVYFAGEDIRLDEFLFFFCHSFFSFFFSFFFFTPVGLGQYRHYLVIASYINQDNFVCNTP